MSDINLSVSASQLNLVSEAVNQYSISWSNAISNIDSLIDTLEEEIPAGFAINPYEAMVEEIIESAKKVLQEAREKSYEIISLSGVLISELEKIDSDLVEIGS